jgi:hypothetical protein
MFSQLWASTRCEPPCCHLKVANAVWLTRIFASSQSRNSGWAKGRLRQKCQAITAESLFVLSMRFARANRRDFRSGGESLLRTVPGSIHGPNIRSHFLFYATPPIHFTRWMFARAMQPTGGLAWVARGGCEVRCLNEPSDLRQELSRRGRAGAENRGRPTHDVRHGFPRH